ncbi:MAG: MarR family EPS-associated transcriptional regulator [Gammaproteobacteria bacterium]|nr:MarR family EPS-associated transcriptional regulator [Gammaproteobacteria bacterium]
MVDEIRYRVLRLLESDPEMSQRDLAKVLGISLGKTNYCLNALIDRGWVKVQNFKNNPSKRGYAYMLTPHGIEEKAKITARFLKFKIAEYEALRLEIAALTKEMDQLDGFEPRLE